ncbi:MAG TPA: septum formation initiator family protein [candidate division Zixibacteria bacterium]|nr:septum formation initiator family protein [candidate division Zixibacteria bacterium]
MSFTPPFVQRWLHYVLGSVLALLAVLTVVGDRGVLHLLRLKGEKARLDEQNYRLQKENELLRQKIRRLRSDNFYLEKLAREELNLVRRGEVIYRFSSPPNGPRAASPVSGASSAPPPSAERREPR